MYVVTPSKSFTIQQSLIQSVCTVAKISHSHPMMCILSVLTALASLLFTRNSLNNCNFVFANYFSLFFSSLDISFVSFELIFYCFDDNSIIMKVSARILPAHVMGNNEYHWNGLISRNFQNKINQLYLLN